MIYAYRMALSAVASVLLCAPAWAAATDARIEDSFKNSYVYKAYLNQDNIQVKSNDGAVTLTGTVSDESHRSLAGEAVSSLPEVRHVDNQIRVENAEVKGSDAWIGVKVKAALLFHQNVSALKTKVDVKDGIVTLTGDAESQAQKDLTEEYAKDVEGVKVVRNQLAIVPPQPKATMKEKIDDASITAQVKVALLSHRSTSAIRTKVDTKDGVVVITGQAKSRAEKDLVTKLARDIDGVNEVVNNMEVQ